MNFDRVFLVLRSILYGWCGVYMPNRQCIRDENASADVSARSANEESVPKPSCINEKDISPDDATDANNSCTPTRVREENMSCSVFLKPGTSNKELGGSDGFPKSREKRSLKVPYSKVQEIGGRFRPIFKEFETFPSITDNEGNDSSLPAAFQKRKKHNSYRYCEICKVNFLNLNEHILGAEHQAHLPAYKSIDDYIIGNNLAVDHFLTTTCNQQKTGVHSSEADHDMVLSGEHSSEADHDMVLSGEHSSEADHDMVLSGEEVFPGADLDNDQTYRPQVATSLEDTNINVHEEGTVSAAKLTDHSDSEKSAEVVDDSDYDQTYKPGTDSFVSESESESDMLSKGNSLFDDLKALKAASSDGPLHSSKGKGQCSSEAVSSPVLKELNPPGSDGFGKGKGQCSSEVVSSTGIRVMLSEGTGKRDYQKRYYCPFCEIPQSRLPRHLECKHKDKPEVAKYMATADKKTRSELLLRLRNLGNHMHNLEVIKEKSGVLIVAYRPSSEASWEDYIPCEYCLGYYVSNELWRHAKRCPLAPTDRKKYHRMVESGRLLLPGPPGIGEGLQKVLSKLSLDDVGRVVKSDPLITQFGEKMYLKLGHDKEQYGYIRNSLRELGRLLIQLRESAGLANAGLIEFIHPGKFQLVIASARKVAGFCETTNQVSTPSLALKIGHSVKKCAKIMKGTALQNGDEAVVNQAVAFQELVEMEWTEQVSSHALRALAEGKRNQVKLIPLVSDVMILTKHLKDAGGCAFEKLQNDEPDVQSWCELSEATLCIIMLFNRRRQGEISKLTLSDLQKKHSGYQEDVQSALSLLERKLCEALMRVEIVGKRGRIVPLLLTATMQKWLDTLVEKRAAVGVNHENVFVFARAHYGSKGHIRGCDVLRQASSSCGAKYPELLRGTKLRKQIATLSQVLNLKDHELDLLADYLGHDVRVHREFYRLPQETLQVAKISKLLLALEKGQMADQVGKNLEEININVDEEETISDAEPSEDSDSDSAAETDGEREFEMMTKQQKKKVVKQVKRKHWKEEEKEAIRNFFPSHMNTVGSVPGKREIEKLLQSAPCLKDRTWKNVKDHIRNCQTTLASQRQKKRLF